MESVFELLFKYRPLLYERGELAFTLPAAWMAAGGVALVLLAVLSYLRARGRAGAGARLTLAGLRLSLLALVLLLLARPVLLVPSVVPQENYLGVLIDDSRSMRIDDGVSRSAFVHETFLDEASGLRTALAGRFRLRVYRFSDVVRRVEAGETLELAGTRTRIGHALGRVRDELGSLPLSGLVLVTDGADHDADALDEALLPLKAGGVPVYTVGVGSESFRRDLEVTAVSAPTTALAGSAVVAEVTLTHAGYDGATVPVTVERDGRIMGTRDVTLDGSGTTTVRVDFEAGDPGPGTFRFRVPVRDGELVDRNNERERTVRVRSGRQKVLYFEGEPRHEVAFLRRAVADDPALQLVTLQRTDQDRYLRLGVDSAAELAGGFPRTRAELFAYRGVVLGSVEASHFSHDQLTMLEEYVARRGGGLLLLGGRRALAEGGWSGTPVAEALPVRLAPEQA
ncbi:MAG: vWA domain-containing protein, partial [Longimicrobiales bacterium]|nr:vWA domain-containing protein [Longimicrobiales bacterium]